MLHQFAQYILLVIIILFLVMLSQKLKVAYPIVLVLGGLALSMVPGIPGISIDPEWIFAIFLPPLLYEAAWYTSWKDLWRWRRVISSFAVLIVIVTSFVVALVSSSMIPGFTMALGFLLGGIVSPPDAVSASSITKYIKVPKRLSAILEGESLLNDASSLIVFRFAMVAVDTGRFVFHEAALSFVVVIVMGVLIGIVIGLIYYAIHKWLPTTPNMDIVLTLTAPYVMYIAAESFHFSGVLAVVSGGLFLSAKSHLFLSHRSRLRGGNVWSTLSFVMNGLVFMLIGLELPVIIRELGQVEVKTAIWYGVLITAVLMLTRIMCTLGSSLFTTLISPYVRTADSHPGWKLPLIFGWTGMRGVVSLAAALSIPYTLTSGAPFPQRNLILFITFTVILLTLVVQGLTLPALIRLVKPEDPDAHVSIHEQEQMIRKKLSDKALEIIDAQSAIVENNKRLQLLRHHLQHEQNMHHVPGSSGQEDYQRIYLQLLNAQRDLLHEMNRAPDLDSELARRYLDLLDVEEEKLRMRFEG